MAGVEVSGPLFRPAVSISSAHTGAQRALERALKTLQRAQEKLAKDLSEGANKETIRADQRAVEVAQAIVTLAQMQLAEEIRRAQERQNDARPNTAKVTAKFGAAESGGFDVLA